MICGCIDIEAKDMPKYRDIFIFYFNMLFWAVYALETECPQSCHNDVLNDFGGIFFIRP